MEGYKYDVDAVKYYVDKEFDTNVKPALCGNLPLFSQELLFKTILESQISQKISIKTGLPMDFLKRQQI